jgi:ATP-dependent helicase/DNAse subunit B
LYKIDSGSTSFEGAISINVTAAPGFETEVYHVAREINYLMETGTVVDLSGFGIILSAKDRMLAVLRRVFAEYSIPYGIAGTVQALTNPEMLWLVDLFSLEAKGFPVEDVFSVLRAPWSTQTSLVPGPEWIRLSRKCISSGIQSFNGTAWRSAIEPDSKAFEIIELFMTSYRTLISSPDIDFWLKRLDDFMATYSVPELGEHDSVVRWRRECEDFRLITSQLEETKDLGSTLLRCAVDRLVRSRTQIPYPPGECVIVGSLEDLFGMEFDRLFILGVNRGIMPGRISEDPLLSDKTRTALSLDLGFHIQTRTSRYQKEKLMFLLMLRSATQSVHITYSTIDEAGKPLAPSILIALVFGHDYAVQTMPYRIVDRIEEQARSGRLVAPRHILWLMSEYDSRLRSGWKEFAILMDSEFFDIFSYGSESRAARYDPDQISRYDLGLTERFEHTVNPLRTVQAWNDLDDCPYRFFLRHVLGLEEHITPKETWWMDELETGNIVHRFFYLLCASEEIHSDIIPQDLARKIWERTRESYLNTCPDDGFSPVRRYELERAGNWIIPVGVRELELLRELRSTFGEIQISREAPLSNFVLTIRLGSDMVRRVPMNIRADRIDTFIHSDQSRIIDYKVRSSRSLWEKDSRNLQLYLYSNAYASAVRHAIQAEYVEIVRRGRPEDVQTLVVPTENERIDELFTTKLRLLGSRWFGEFPCFPFTRDKDTCSYCRMKVYCRRFDTPLFEKSAWLSGEYWRKHADLNDEIKEELKPYLDERYP